MFSRCRHRDRLVFGHYDRSPCVRRADTFDRDRVACACPTGGDAYGERVADVLPPARIGALDPIGTRSAAADRRESIEVEEGDPVGPGVMQNRTAQPGPTEWKGEGQPGP